MLLLLQKVLHLLIRIDFKSVFVVLCWGLFDLVEVEVEVDVCMLVRLIVCTASVLVIVALSFNVESLVRSSIASSSLGRSIDKVRKGLEDVQETTEKVSRVKKFTNKLIGTKKAYSPPMSKSVKPYRGSAIPSVTSEKCE